MLRLFGFSNGKTFATKLSLTKGIVLKSVWMAIERPNKESKWYCLGLSLQSLSVSPGKGGVGWVFSTISGWSFFASGFLHPAVLLISSSWVSRILQSSALCVLPVFRVSVIRDKVHLLDLAPVWSLMFKKWLHSFSECRSVFHVFSNCNPVVS